jgi:hypothetical protein
MGTSYRRRPTANPSSAPPTTSTMITIRMNLPTPARKPRASSSVASRPTWAAVKIMAPHGKAWCAAALPKAWQVDANACHAYRLLTQRLYVLLDTSEDLHRRNLAGVLRVCARYVPKLGARVLRLLLSCTSHSVVISEVLPLKALLRFPRAAEPPGRSNVHVLARRRPQCVVVSFLVSSVYVRLRS